MDVAAARTALRAWQLQPRAVRREVVALSRKGLPAPDPAIAKLAVDWSRSAWPLTYGPVLWFTAGAVVVTEARQYARGHPGMVLMDVVGLLSIVAMFAYVIVIMRRHHRAQETATVNLRGLLAIGAYAPREVLEVRAAPTPRWFIPGLLALIAFFVAADIFGAWLRSEDLGAVYAGPLCFPLVFGGGIYLIRTLRQSETTGRRPRGSTPMLTLRPDGLEVHRLGRTVAWSDVNTADVAPSSSTNALPLAIGFTLREPDQTSTSSVRLREKDRTVTFPVHWLDQDPGVILATARHHMPASTAP
jgi:hypothetical protein